MSNDPNGSRKSPETRSTTANLLLSLVIFMMLATFVGVWLMDANTETVRYSDLLRLIELSRQANQADDGTVAKILVTEERVLKQYSTLRKLEFARYSLTGEIRRQDMAKAEMRVEYLTGKLTAMVLGVTSPTNSSSGTITSILSQPAFCSPYSMIKIAVMFAAEAMFTNSLPQRMEIISRLGSSSMAWMLSE